MRTQENNSEAENATPAAEQSAASVSELPIIANVRTGLVGKDNAIYRTLPGDYVGKTYRQAIDYLTGASNLTDEESSLAESVKKQTNERGSVVVANGHQVKMDDQIAKKDLAAREHEVPGAGKKQYLELELEVSAVQQGGLFYRLVR